MKKLLLIIPLLLILAGCSKSEDGKSVTLNRNSLKINSGETFTLMVTGDGDAKFTSKEPLIASVDENGVVKGRIVGKTEILVNTKSKTLKCDVEVNYSDKAIIIPPITTWGVSKDKIKEMANKIPEGIGEVFDDGKNLSYTIDIPFVGKYLYIYSFNAKGLFGATVMIVKSDLATNMSQLKRLSEYSMETYVTVAGSREERKFYLSSMDKKTVAVMDLREYALLIFDVNYKDQSKH